MCCLLVVRLLFVCCLFDSLFVCVFVCWALSAACCVLCLVCRVMRVVGCKLFGVCWLLLAA